MALASKWSSSPRGKGALLGIASMLVAACGATRAGPARAVGPAAEIDNHPMSDAAAPAAPALSGRAREDQVTQDAGESMPRPVAPDLLPSEADFTALGLNGKTLPPIEKLEPRALRAVMKVMAKSVGLKCGDCHVDGDFAAPTARKRIAARMWDEFAAKMTLSDGSPLFCDSCHQGHTKFLDRSDRARLEDWMQANFVDRLKRKDEQPERCETCHVGGNMTFLGSWARGG